MRKILVCFVLWALSLMPLHEGTGKTLYTYIPVDADKFIHFNLERRSLQRLHDVVPRETRKKAPVRVHKPHRRVLVAVVAPRAAAKKYAFNRLGAVQYSCLDKIFTRESHWNYRDYNRSSGAYGIPQALPGSKMSVFGSDWRTNPVTQVKWGIHYVNGRYGSACRAWLFWQSHNWY